jgi:hypothetical protein
MRDDIYDDATWDAVDRWHTPPRRIPTEVASGWRASLGATALMTAVALGVQDVLEPKHSDPVIEEIDLDELWSDDLPVVYHHVPGAPKASRAVVRPWLIG